MNIEFKPNRLMDAVIFAGGDINLGIYSSSTDIGLLQGEVEKKAFENLRNSYEQHKQKMQNINFSFGRYLNTVENNIAGLSTIEMGQIARDRVSATLSLLAKNRINGKEKDFSWIYMIFHKIGQFFQGHGFQTKGEWGLELASYVKKMDVCLESIEKHIFSGLRSNIDKLKVEINDLSIDQFKKVLKYIIFEKCETDFFEVKNKYKFYTNLNEEKKEIFDQELLARADWYDQAFDIIEGFVGKEDEKKLTDFISLGMTEKFKANPKKYIVLNNKDPRENCSWWALDPQPQKKYQNFFYIILEKTIKNYLNEGSPEAFVNIGKLINYNFETNKVINRENGLLTEDDKNKINANVIHVKKMTDFSPKVNTELDKRKRIKNPSWWALDPQ